MATQTKPVVKNVKISDIAIGDKLRQDIIGYSATPGQSHILFYQGTMISHRELIFLREQINKKPPFVPPERYIIGVKTPGIIWTQDGRKLLNGGDVVTEEALAPLLEEGFEIVPTNDGGQMFYRKNSWPDDSQYEWNIEKLNPLVMVETLTYVDDQGKEVPDPRGQNQKVGTRGTVSTTRVGGKFGVAARPSTTAQARNGKEKATA